LYIYGIDVTCCQRAVCPPFCVLVYFIDQTITHAEVNQTIINSYIKYSTCREHSKSVARKTIHVHYTAVIKYNES